MAEPFDAYSQWFDIPRGRRPPNLYELLGLDAFESNAENIETAFQKRYALVRQYQVGEHGDDAIRVLQELAKAHDCLSNEEEKEQYDNKLLDESPELAPVLEVEAEPAKPKPVVPVEQRKIWIIMPAEGRRWGPLVKSQIEQAVSQGRIRSDYYFQQDDWLKPRPVTEFYRNLPPPSRPRLTPVGAQPTGPTFTVRQMPTSAITASQGSSSYGWGGKAPASPTTHSASARQPPWHVIIPCVGIGVVLLVLIPLLVIGLGGGSEGDEASPISTGDNSPGSLTTTGANKLGPRSETVATQSRSGSPRERTPNSIGTPSTQDWRTWTQDARFSQGRSHIAISPDGEVLASIGTVGIYMWRLVDGKRVGQFTGKAIGDKTSSLSFSPDSSMLAIGNNDGTISVWPRKGIGPNHKLSSDAITDICFRADGETLMYRDGEHSVAVVRVSDLLSRLRDIKPLKSFKPPGDDNNPIQLKGFALSPSDDRLAVVGVEHISTWNAEGTQKIWEIRSDRTVYDACFSPDGALLAVRDSDKFEVYDASTGKRLTVINSRRGPPTDAKELAFSPDGPVLAVRALGMIELWRVPKTEMLKKVSIPFGGEAFGLALGLDGRILAAAGSSLVVLRRGDYSGSSTTVSNRTGNSSGGPSIARNEPSAEVAAPNRGAYELPPSDKAIDLVSLIDPARDAVKGDWKIESGKLICSTQHFVPKLEIPYIPPEEYDFRVVFSQPKLRNPVNLLMPNKGESFIWAVGGTRGTYYFSLEGKNTAPTQSWLDGLVKPNQLHTSVVQVRKNSVKGFVDGELRVDYKTDFSDLKANSWHRIRDKRLLGVECDDPTTFHRIELIEITGTGTRTR